MTAPRQMKLGAALRWLGYHMASWRHPDVRADGAVHFDYFLDSALKAEAAKFDLIFFADGVAIKGEDNPPGYLSRDIKNVELEPLTLLAAIAARTTHIGLAATASTSYNQPYHIARKFSSLDHISKGRAAWNVVTSTSHQEALNFNRDAHFAYSERYEIAAEFVEVVTGLWDSWEPDAFIRNKQSGILYDPTKRHVLDHVGKHFKVRGPLGSARTPQGRPIIIQAGASETGRNIGARTADIIYTSTLDFGESRLYYADMKARAARAGRDPATLLIMPGVTTYVGATRAEAEAKFAQMQALIDPVVGMGVLIAYFGDVSHHDIDGPVPEPRHDAPLRSIAMNMYRMAQRNGMTIRDLFSVLGAASGNWYLVGSVTEIADEFERWFTGGAADGFNICPAVNPSGLEDFISLVVPELRRRKLFRDEYEGTTLRQNLGLPMPEFGDVRSRMALGREADAVTSRE